MLPCLRIFWRSLNGTGGGWGCPFYAVVWFLIGAGITSLLTRQNGTQNHEETETKEADVSSNALIVYRTRDFTIRVLNASQSEEGNKDTIAVQAEDLLDNIRRGNNQDVADLLERDIRILCMVTTTQVYHEERAVHVKSTWGQRCSSLIFLSDKENPSLPAIKVSPHIQRGEIWAKVRAGFRWAYENHLNNFDWFLKADDDTFFFMENLRALLVEYNPNDGIYLGHEFANKETDKEPKFFNGGGAGYVLSREAVVKLVEQAFPMPKYCSSSRFEQNEATEMARCLQHVGISTMDTRDFVGRQRFLPLPPRYLLSVSLVQIQELAREKYPYKQGEKCCSNMAISFHCRRALVMSELEYFIYRLHLFGRNIFSKGDVSLVRQNSAYKLVQDKLTANKYVGRQNRLHKASVTLPSEEELSNSDDALLIPMREAKENASNQTTT